MSSRNEAIKLNPFRILSYCATLITLHFVLHNMQRFVSTGNEKLKSFFKTIY